MAISRWYSLMMKTQWAEAGSTVIPNPPVAGTAYRNTAVDANDIARGQKFDGVADSARWNQLLYIITGILKDSLAHGVLPWINVQDYAEGAVVMGSNGTLYRAKLATGPATSNSKDPVTDSSNTIWVRVVPIAKANGGLTLDSAMQLSAAPDNSTIKLTSDGKLAGVPMKGASSSADGASGLVPKPLKTQYLKPLRGDGTYADSLSCNITGWAKDVAVLGESTDLASKRGQIGEPFSLGTGKNLNTIVASGNYWIFATDAQNVPVANSGFLLVYRNSNNITQLYIAHNTATLYVRVSNDSGQNWEAWRKVATSDTVGGFLPLYGGTMTGTIESSAGYALKHTADNSTLRIFGGASVSESPAIYMNGKNATENAGAVQIIARASTTAAATLSLTPSGAIKFAEKNIVRSVNGVNADAGGNVTIGGTLSNATVAVWDSNTDLTVPAGGTWAVLYFQWGTDWGAPDIQIVPGGTVITKTSSRLVALCLKIS